jgi:hypothetical protein
VPEQSTAGGRPRRTHRQLYETLRTHYPDHPPLGDDSPWALAPVDVGIDHVSMSLRHGPTGATVVDPVLDLATRHGLTIYDPQSDTVTRPPGDASMPT